VDVVSGVVVGGEGAVVVSGTVVGGAVVGGTVVGASVVVGGVVVGASVVEVSPVVVVLHGKVAAVMLVDADPGHAVVVVVGAALAGAAVAEDSPKVENTTARTRSTGGPTTSRRAKRRTTHPWRAAGPVTGT
jgi:hypothetical protein